MVKFIKPKNSPGEYPYNATTVELKNGLRLYIGTSDFTLWSKTIFRVFVQKKFLFMWITFGEIYEGFYKKDTETYDDFIKRIVSFVNED